MKIQCNRKSLLAVTRLAAKVVSTRTTKPILTSILIVANDNGEVYLFATDLETSLRYLVPDAQILEPGDGLLPAKAVLAALRASTDTTLVFTSDAIGLDIMGDRTHMRLSTQDPEEYPCIPQIDKIKYRTVAAQDLRSLILRLIFAVDSESASRYTLNGIALEFDTTQMVGVATDGRRLAHACIPAETIGDCPVPLTPPIVPTATMKVLVEVLRNVTENVQISILTPNPFGKIFIWTSTMQLTSYLQEGRFPLWREILNLPTTTTLQLDVAPLANALRAIALPRSKATTQYTTISLSPGQMLLTTKADGATATQQITAPADCGEFTTTLSHQYLTEFFSQPGLMPTLTMSVSTNMAACIFRQSNGYTYVVMPLDTD